MSKLRFQSILNTTAKHEVTRHIQILPGKRGLFLGLQRSARDCQSVELFKRLRTCVTRQTEEFLFVPHICTRGELLTDRVAP